MEERARRWITANGLRWCLRGGVLVACSALLFSEGARHYSVLVPALSPLVMLCGVLTTRVMPWFGWGAVVVLVVVAWRQRWFCRWICPTGFCADKASWTGRRLGRGRGRWPAIGQWIAVVTLVSACVGYPLLLWLDPLALLTAAFSSGDASRTPIALWYASGLVLVLVVSLVWPNAWCASLCPLGGMQDAVYGAGDLVRSTILGGAQRKPIAAGPLRGLRRRTVLGVIVGIVWATVTLKVRGQSVGPLRPPGSEDESSFSGLCIRCGNCSRACPTQIITCDCGSHGVASLLTPTVTFQHDYCLEICNQCTIVCPSGALRPIPLADKIHATIGAPVVDMDICLLGDDRDCFVCRNRCPYEAISLVFSETDYTLTPRVDLDRCPGCGACQVACPTSPEKAIVVRPVAREAWMARH